MTCTHTFQPPSLVICTNYVYALQDPDATDFNIITCDTELDGKHTSLAASFNVAPNTIDFSSVWSQFANLDSNPVVFSVVISTLCIYAVLLVWSTRKDRQDKIRVSISAHHCTAKTIWNVTIIEKLESFD